MGNRVGEAVVLNSLGGARELLGDKQRALEYYTQAREIFHSSGHAAGEAGTICYIGRIYFALGNHREALSSLRQGLSLIQALGDRRSEGEVLGDIGAVYASLGDRQRALRYFQQAELLNRETGYPRMQAYRLNDIGRILEDSGDKQKAREYYLQALPLNLAVEDRRGENVTRYNIAHLELSRGNFAEAYSQLELSLQRIESLRTRVAGQDLRSSYFASVNQHYGLYIDLLMQMHKQLLLQGHDASALQASERARARSLLESLVEARADIRQGVDPLLLERERSLQATLSAKAERQMRLLSGKHTEEEAAALSKEMSKLSTEYTEVQALIRGNSPRYAALTQPQPLTVPQIQQEVLDPETLLLEYSLGDERSYLWAVTDTSLHSYELPGRSDIEKTARKVNALLLASQPQAGEMLRDFQKRTGEAEKQFREESAALSRILLGPAAELLGTKRLLIVAEGALQYIPFSALPEPDAKTEDSTAENAFSPLILKHEVVNLPSASVMAILRRETHQRPSPAKMIAVLADPVFESDDPRLARKEQNRKADVEKPSPEHARPARTRASRRIASSSSINVITNLQRAFRDVRTRGEFNIPRLPSTREEAEAILAFTPPELNLKALDFQASRSTATSSILSQYRVVHFATHGLLDSETPELSGLVLSLLDEQGRPQNGFLRLDDIYNLNLPVDLVVLSACNSGLGKEVRGEGLVGIVRGFMYAGAARVVASLWKVEDEATAELMKRFYRHMFQGGEPASAALRAAQIEMLQQKRWRYPYFWAAFILQGEWK
jgi:CHAT domain-containing protein